jgi:hypothetical protein
MEVTELVVLGHDDVFRRQFTEGGEAVDLSSATKITASFGDVLIEGTGGASDPLISWADSDPPPAGWVKGEVRFSLGGEAIPHGFYEVPLFYYDAVYSNGVMFGVAPVNVIEDPEAT